MRVVRMFDIPLHDLSENELNASFVDWLRGGEAKMVVTPNPEMILAARKDATFRATLQGADLSLPDGVGLQYAAMTLLRTRIRRHTGVDAVMRLAELCAVEGTSLLIFGGVEGRAESAAHALEARFPGLQASGIYPGAVRIEKGRVVYDEDAFAELILRAPSVLIVALGQGKQEIFIAQELQNLPSIRIAIGAGGAVDMIANAIPRAPKFMRVVGLEWAWRLMREPRRIHRILNAVVVFPVLVAWSTLRRTTTK